MKASKLDYYAKCLELKWKDPQSNKLKIELISHGHGHYSVKETILNPYTYEDYCREQNKVNIIKKILKFFK